MEEEKKKTTAKKETEKKTTTKKTTTSKASTTAKKTTNKKVEKEEPAKKTTTKKKETVKEEAVVAKEPEVVKEETTEVKQEVVNQPKVEVQEEKKEEKEEKVENISSKGSNNGSKGPVMVGIIAILLIAIAACIFYYVNVFLSPNQTFKRVINSTKNEIAEFEFDDKLDSKTVTAAFSLDVDLKLSTMMSSLIDSDIINLINDLTLDMETKINEQDDTMTVYLKLDKANTKVLDVYTYLVDNKLYFKVQDLIDKLLYLDVEDLEVLEEDGSYEELYKQEQIIVNSLCNAFSSSLDSKYFTKEKVDGKTKNTLVLNNDNLKSLIKDIINKLSVDDKFLTTIAEISKVEKEEVTDSLKQMLDEIDSQEMLEEGMSINISILTKNLNPKMCGALIEVIDGENVNGTLNINVISDDEIDYSININEVIINGNLKTETKSKDEFVTEFSINSSDIGSLAIKLNTKYLVDDSKISLPDLSSAVSVDDLGMSDFSTILKNIQENEAIMEIYELIATITGNDSDLPDYNDDYIYDDDTDYDYDYDDEDEDEDIETAENEISYFGEIDLVFEVADGFKYKNSYSGNTYKYYEKKSGDSRVEVSARVTIEDEDEYFEDVEKYDYEYLTDDDDDFYSNVEKSDIITKKINGNTFKYMKITYNAGSSLYYEELYAICTLDDEHAYIIEITSKDTEIDEDILKKFGKFEVKE